MFLKNLSSLILLSFIMQFSNVFAQNTAPEVTNVTALQQTGTTLVDITYDVADADNDNMTVTVMVSSDGGETFSITAASLSGDAGSDVESGIGKSIVWDAGADHSDQYGTNYVVKVIADDGGPAPGYTGEYGSVTIEGLEYKTVVIGDQVWMAENLRVTINSLNNMLEI